MAFLAYLANKGGFIYEVILICKFNNEFFIFMKRINIMQGPFMIEGGTGGAGPAFLSL